jgi:hypothetical protein
MRQLGLWKTKTNFFLEMLDPALYKFQWMRYHWYRRINNRSIADSRCGRKLTYSVKTLYEAYGPIADRDKKKLATCSKLTHITSKSSYPTGKIISLFSPMVLASRLGVRASKSCKTHMP